VEQCAAGTYNDVTFTNGWFGQYYTYAQAMENSNFLGFDALTPVVTSNTATIHFPNRGTWPWESAQWGARWRGIITIVTAGAYTFSLNSDDGSWLWVNEVMIVNYGGHHGMEWGPVLGTVTLSAGTHKVRVHFFEAGGGAGIVVMYTGPGLSGMTLLPASSSSLTCLSCPTNSMSPVSSSTITACVCNAGSSGPDGGTCTQCLGGTYKSGTGNSGCVGCPALSSSPAGSTAVAACICNAGSSGPDGGTCTQCLAGTYKSTTGNTGCVGCSEGKFGSTQGGTAEAVCVSCPANSISPVGSNAVSQCSCVAGWSVATGSSEVFTIFGTGTRTQHSSQAWCPDFIAPTDGYLEKVTILTTGATNNNGFIVIRSGVQLRGTEFIANAQGPEVVGSMAYETRTRFIDLDFKVSDRFTGLQITTLVMFPRA